MSKAAKKKPSPAAKSAKPMPIGELAAAFTKALKAGDYAAAEAFWSDDVISIENMDGPMKKLSGRKAVHDKGQWWYGAHEINSFKAQGPFINGDSFALLFKLDVTRKEDGERVKMDEVGLYKVKAGRIVEERFFY